MKTSGQRSALVALAATVLAWASVPLILRHFALRHILDAWTVNGIRYFFTALFWLPMVIGTYQQVPAGRKVWKDALAPAGFHTVGQIAWGLAPYYNSAGVMNFVSRIGFLFTIIAGFWILKEERFLSRRPMFWVGSAGTVAGLVVMFAGGIDIGNTSAGGMTILILAALCWSFYAVNVRSRMQAYDARFGFGIVSLLVAPFLLALMFVFGDWRAALHIGALNWFLLALSGWVAIAMGHVLYYQALRALGPIVAEGALALIPFLTALLAHLVLGENLRASQWIGGTLLVVSSLVLLHARLKPNQAPGATENLPSG